MKLDRLITLASRRTRLAFLAMERSLRATGCDLPLAVIPYGDDRFELPADAEWWEVPELLGWLAAAVHHPHPRGVMRKYQCLLAANYQYVDTDVAFLRDPAAVLEPLAGVVTSCGHWHNPGDTVTAESRASLHRRTTTWQKGVFNTGQFACDRPLYDFATLRRTAEQPGFRATCLDNPFHEQMGINLLVDAAGVPITNLTLPPHHMESTWAGDYPGEFEHYWRDPATKPYLIHWAGTKPDGARPIDALFLQFLSAPEREEWARANPPRPTAGRAPGGAPLAARFRRAWRAFTS